MALKILDIISIKWLINLIQKCFINGGPKNSIYDLSKIIYWKNCKDDGDKSIFPYAIVYIKNAGFFTQYDKWTVKDSSYYSIGYFDKEYTKFDINGKYEIFDIDDHRDVEDIINNFFNGK